MYNFVIFAFFLVVNFDNFHFLPIEDEDENILVETSNGKLKGKLLKSQILDLNYYAFQSIPYAEPPIEDLRFKDPISISNWTGVLDATSAPKVCPQPFLHQDEMSEDCLFLNIFTPYPKPSDLLPVIFWIHGGFFMIGGGRIENNRPDLFINENVIVVSINYRLGIFGFLSFEDNIIPGNYGLKDQLMALRWVYDNIAQFGGDPFKITLMGQSAGAANVGLLLQTPLSQGLFSAAILQSGNSLNLWSRARNPKVMTKEIANLFSIKYENSQDLLNGLQKIKWTDLLTSSSVLYYANAVLSNPMNGFPLGPNLEENTNGILNGKSHDKLRSGKFNRVPILTGYNSAETNSFIEVFNKAKLFVALYDIIPSRLVPSDLNGNSTHVNEIGRTIKEFYFGSTAITQSKQLFINFLNDHEFIRPAIEFAKLLSEYTDTYLYRFSYVGQLPVVKESQRQLPGAVHAEELRYIFYSPDENPATDADLLTRRRLVKLWANFAKYHNPTPTPDDLFQNITWKPLEKGEINYLNIDADLQMLKNPSEKNITFWDTLYSTYGNPPYDTY
ncbi:hypothetical protein WA026_005566 [Henosepilachna vigintioctopunctata]|uniref:Carboxylic ester hydrolase n=1 Tax=Henosepilachna vigintioctopunctata TaxID=420089 RepID=A0AAW1U4D1_9CUCU